MTRRRSPLAATVALLVAGVQGTPARAWPWAPFGSGGQVQMNQVAALPTPFDYLLASHEGWDFDHDGKMEFVASKKFEMSSVTFLFYESVGDNSFGLVHQLQFSVPQGQVISYLASDVGDVDGDGLTDMTIHGKAAGNYRVRLLESPSVGAYPTQTVWALPTASFEREVKIADTDGDGNKELVIGGANVTENRIEIRENTGDNTFRQTFYHGFSYALLNNAQSMTIADDLDGDGCVEILMGGLGQNAADKSTSRVVALESTGNDSYEQSWSVELPHSEGHLVNASALIDAGDLDGDGKKEFIVGGGRTISGPGSQFFSVLYVYEAVADNTFSAVASLERFMGCPCTVSVALADIDGDGKREIVHGTELGWSIYRNTGNNTWTEIWSAPAPGSDFMSIAAGDHDQDGKDEVIVPQSWIYEVDPADAADLDGDGLVDTIDNCPAVVNPSQEDADVDAVGDFCDNCVHGPNPDQGPAPFGQTIRAEDLSTFSWTIPADIVHARGNLSVVSGYAVDVVGSAALATSWTDPSVPAAGGGLYYLVRPDCPVGSWQSSIGAEPGRDAALP